MAVRFPASAGWTLKIHLAGVNVLTKAAEPDGDDFVVTITPADTDSELGAGLYKWIERVSNAGGEVYEVASGIGMFLKSPGGCPLARIVYFKICEVDAEISAPLNGQITAFFAEICLLNAH